MASPLQLRAIARSASSTWREHAPSAEHAKAIDCTWTGVGGFDHSILLAPDGCVDIVWDGRSLAAVLPQANGIRRWVEAKSVNVGLRLACGWAGALLGPDLPTAAGLDIDLEALWGDFGREVTKRLRAAPGSEAQRTVVEALVVERLGARPGPSATVLEALRLWRRDPSLPLDDLRRRLRTPARTLRRQVAGATGLSPKSLQRVLRFQAMRRRLVLGAKVESAALLAADLGFADQAHMTRECRVMTGRTPTALWRMDVGGRNLQDAEMPV